MLFSVMFSDSRLAGADDRTHNLEGPLLQAGRGSSRLPHAQLHREGEVSFITGEVATHE